MNMEESLKSRQLLHHDDNICLACGLCCDGSLIGFVELQKEEIPKIKKLMDVEDSHGNGFFLQPCKKYCNGCTIYENRPSNCDKFNCGLLQSVNQNEIAFEDALLKVQEVKDRKAVIQKQIALLHITLKSPSFYFKMVELKKVLKKLKLASLFTSAHEELSLNLFQLDQLLFKDFNLSFE